MDARIAPQKPDWTTHQKNGLNNVSNGIEQEQGRNETSCAAPFEEYEEVAEHHEVDANAALNDQKVFPRRALHEERVDFLSPDEGVVSEALTFGEHQDLLVLERGHYQEHCDENTREDGS